MRAMISLCAMLLVAAIGCSKTDDSADRTAPSMDEAPATSTPGDMTDPSAPSDPGTMPPTDQSTPPPADETMPPATPPPNP
ncbi:MAG: hypothetical protein ACREV5_19325 [Steroidobacter sp.]